MEDTKHDVVKVDGKIIAVDMTQKKEQDSPEYQVAVKADALKETALRNNF